MKAVDRIVLFATWLLASTPAGAAPVYYTREVGSLAECRTQYDAVAGNWHRPSFMLRRVSGGCEHALNCLPDGVSEFMCNPAGGKLVVAVAPGETEAACHAFSSDLPQRRPLLPVR